MIPEHLLIRLDDPEAEKERLAACSRMILADIAVRRHQHRWGDRLLRLMIGGVLLLALLGATGVIGHR